MAQGEKYRVTASTFSKIMKRKSPPTASFVRTICNPKDISNLPFVKYGRENEGRVSDLYVAKMHREGNTGLRIAEVVYVSSKPFHILGHL